MFSSLHTSRRESCHLSSLEPSPLDGTDVAIAVRAQGAGPLNNVARYISLTKPRVLAGNVLTTIAGFALASAGVFDFAALGWVTLGTTLVIAAACVVNNILDRDIDQSMARTKKRVSVTGAISARAATIFAILLGVSGLLVLLFLSSPLVAAIGVAGFLVYVVLYGMWTKRMSVHGTLVGSISGAIPVLAGYVAVTGAFDGTALIAFLMMFLWQEPEFYSIAIYRRDEYKAAGVPVISVSRGIEHTKRQILLYTVLFAASALALPLFGGVGITYTVVMGIVSLVWIVIAIRGLRATDDAQWARGNFRYSLWVVLIMCAMFAIGPVLP
ncbi:protoheme IX farnesyltransferase [Agromyces atrinae]|uniref:Protoheme IX farnesyltransferase n=1 Tax=Agromyces atrinae TaxID=592376 RepID=A0A4Q2M6Q2_9MICO|nr:protoheme IX farnesyltransferase [Agromyces atrinae]